MLFELVRLLQGGDISVDDSSAYNFFFYSALRLLFLAYLSSFIIFFPIASSHTVFRITFGVVTPILLTVRPCILAAN